MIFQGVVTFLFIVVGGITELIQFVAFLIWIFYGLAMVSLLILRRTKKHVHRPYKVKNIIFIDIKHVPNGLIVGCNVCGDFYYCCFDLFERHSFYNGPQSEVLSWSDVHFVWCTFVLLSSLQKEEILLCW